MFGAQHTGGEGSLSTTKGGTQSLVGWDRGMLIGLHSTQGVGYKEDLLTRNSLSGLHGMEGAMPHMHAWKTDPAFPGMNSLEKAGR